MRAGAGGNRRRSARQARRTGRGDGLVLYPHFYPHVVPGWLDHSLRWRRVVALSTALADELRELLATGRVADTVQPL